jgi:hypothetical protein
MKGVWVSKHGTKKNLPEKIEVSLIGSPVGAELGQTTYETKNQNS